MDRLSPEAAALLRRYRAARPGAGGAQRNYREVLSRVAVREAKPMQGDSWQRQLLWGLAAAAAAALLLVVVDAVLPAAQTAAEGTPTGRPSEALDGAIKDGNAGSTVKSVDARPKPAAEPEPEPERAALAQPAPGAKSPSPELVPDRPVGPAGLAEETRLLRLAREAMRSGDLATARVALDEHARRFSRGALAEDRSAYDVVLRCRSEDPAAKKHRGAFERAYPRSPHAPRIAEACGERSFE